MPHIAELDSKVLVLDEGTPKRLAGLAAVLTVIFRETMGSTYAEIVVAIPGQAPVRFAARNSGTIGQFSVGDAAYAITVLVIDWRTRRVQAIIGRSPVVREDG